VESGRRERPPGFSSGSFGRGFAGGAFIAIATAVALGVSANFSQESGTPDKSPIEVLFLALSYGTPLVGYVIGIALAIPRWTRRSGLGLLVGLTLVLPGAVFISAVVVWESP